MTNEVKTEKCGTCRYWRDLDTHWSGAYGDCQSDELREIGVCRRYPPRPTGEKEYITMILYDENDAVTADRETTDYPATEFPFTQDFEWCGEWNARKAGLPMADISKVLIVESGLDTATVNCLRAVGFDSMDQALRHEGRVPNFGPKRTAELRGWALGWQCALWRILE